MKSLIFLEICSILVAKTDDIFCDEKWVVFFQNKVKLCKVACSSYLNEFSLCLVVEYVSDVFWEDVFSCRTCVNTSVGHADGPRRVPNCHLHVSLVATHFAGMVSISFPFFVYVPGWHESLTRSWEGLLRNSVQGPSTVKCGKVGLKRLLLVTIPSDIVALKGLFDQLGQAVSDLVR